MAILKFSQPMLLIQTLKLTSGRCFGQGEKINHILCQNIKNVSRQFTTFLLLFFPSENVSAVCPQFRCPPGLSSMLLLVCFIKPHLKPSTAFLIQSPSVYNLPTRIMVRSFIAISHSLVSYLIYSLCYIAVTRKHAHDNITK